MDNKKILHTTETAVKPDYTAEITEILHSDAAPKKLMYKLEDYHANDIADVLSTLSEKERKNVCKYKAAHKPTSTGKAL